MAKRKSASGGQSQGTNQAAAGGASRSLIVNMKVQTTVITPTLPSSSVILTSLQPKKTGNRSQGPGNGARKSQGNNAQPSNFARDAKSEPRADRSITGAPKRNRNWSNNHQKQGPSANQGTASIPQVAAATLGWGQMPVTVFPSSWFFPPTPAPPVDSNKPERGGIEKFAGHLRFVCETLGTISETLEQVESIWEKCENICEKVRE